MEIFSRKTYVNTYTKINANLEIAYKNTLNNLKIYKVLKNSNTI